MTNTLDTISERLSNIESLLLDIKHQPVKLYNLLTIAEAAAYLNVQPSAIHDMMQRNELTVSKRGRYVYLYRQELDDRQKLLRIA